jgi:CubicO group peptidase (beta-lactamase class C family)
MLRFLPLLSASLLAQAYFPGAHNDWTMRTAGFDAAKLSEAISFAKASESKSPRDLKLSHDFSFGREMYGEPLGPFKPRGEMTGVIVKDGYIVAEWGEPQRVDMTFSVTKSFVSTTVGLAVAAGLIQSVHDPVRQYVATGEFDGPLNAKITWDHLLRQTSDWEGTLWGKPDWADRPPAGKAVQEYRTRKHNAPGTSYKYNDVRVNLLAYAALQVWRRPLPQVLKEKIMDPIGASNTWRWHGYENSWVELDGLKMQSVAGGAHWGGGMWITARDQARFGLLTVRNGMWKGKALLAPEWIRMARTPTSVQPNYGFMNWYLNTGKKQWPSAPAAAFAHVGNGTNIIYCDPERDLVVVLRWIEGGAIDGFLQRLYAAMQ